MNKTPSDLAELFGLAPAAVPPECGSSQEHHGEALLRYEGNSDALWQDKVITGKDTNAVRQSEQPEHRAMIALKAEGLSTSEIASRLGYEPSTVSTVLRQPWARQRLVALLTASGLAGVTKMLEGEVIPSILRQIEIRDDPASPRAVALNASQALLDRFLGKAVARIETTSVPPLPTSVEELREKITSLEAEEKRLKSN
jgi:transcriptional regulator with XRE-family HTH domain